MEKAARICGTPFIDPHKFDQYHADELDIIQSGQFETGHHRWTFDETCTCKYCEKVREGLLCILDLPI